MYRVYPEVDFLMHSMHRFGFEVTSRILYVRHNYAIRLRIIEVFGVTAR